MRDEERILDRWRSGWTVTLAAVAAALMVACGSDEPDTAATATALATASEEARASASPTPEPTSTPTSSAPTADPTAAATSAPEPTEAPATATPTETAVAGYSSNSVMHALISNLSRESFYDSSSVDEPLAAIRENGDLSLVPVMIDLMRFMSGGASGEAMIAVLEDLTGQAYGGDWNQWMEWLGQNASDYTPPDDYPDWKVRLYSMIHPRFANFLRDGENARIDLVEVTWGGVIPDGIPDLRNPLTLTVAEAGYMNPDDRVFGVSINGEHRAYPLRIINAHEMANDILGGEPISVMW